jgi:crossover junction endodeoxyribonuclease RuvC
MESGERIILGIDPGTTILGFGIIRAGKKDPEFITMGILDLRKEEDHFTKLSLIFEKTSELISQYKPAELAVEAPFFGKNVQSMLKLGRAQGAAIAAALHMGLPVSEYAPRKIKLAITGLGNASKEQVAAILQRTLNISEMPKNLDATDGLAAAVCHFYQKKTPAAGKSFNSWKDYIAQNPGKKK